jgi:hypothetical protein
MAVALAGVVTFAGGGTGTVSQILSGQGSVKSAWLSMTESGVTLSGPYDFQSSMGRFEVTGTYQGTVCVHGDLSWVSATMFWEERERSDDVSGGLPVPRPLKPWLASPPASSQGGAIGDILFGLPVQAKPVELTDALQRQVTSTSSMGFGHAAGTEAHEYRLVLALDGLADVVAKSDGSIEVLGKRHPVFIWVDGDNRLVKLSTSIGFNNSARNLTVSLTYSRFNENVAIGLPSAGSVETLRQYQEQLSKAWGCPPSGGECKSVRRTTTRTG